MSIRLRSNAGRVISQSTLTILMAASLAGCSSLGIGSNNQSEAPLYTGSVQTSSTANLNQSMPGALSPASEARGPYLPPADIGVAAQPSNIVTGSIPQSSQTVQLGASQPNPIVTQPLPTLPQNPTSGSQTTMQTSQNVTPLFQDNPVPQVIPVQQAAPVQRAVTPVVTAMVPQTAANTVPEGTYQHTIERGESLFAISRRYGVTTDAVISANNMTSPDQIYVGQKIYIPGRPDLMASRAQQTQVDPTTTASIEPVTPQAQVTRTVQTIAVTPTPVVQTPAQPTQVATNTTPSAAAQSFRWPIQGRVVVDFETSRQTGINIEAPEGAAVRAAEGGTVIYVGNGVEGYGNLVLVRHSNGYVSAYAHLKDINVTKDDVVSRGEAIGSVGMSGSVNRPQLHFELRQGATPVDPMPLLAG